MNTLAVNSNYAPGLSLNIQILIGLKPEFTMFGARDYPTRPTLANLIRAEQLLTERTPPAARPEKELERTRFISEHQSAIINAYQNYIKVITGRT